MFRITDAIFRQFLDQLLVDFDVVLALQTQVQALQAQNLQASVKELASALETLKAEAAQPVAASEPVVEAVAVETSAPAPTTSSKKKSAV